MCQDTTVLLKELGPKRTGFLNNGLLLKILLIWIPYENETNKKILFIVISWWNINELILGSTCWASRGGSTYFHNLCVPPARMTGGFQRLHGTDQGRGCWSALVKSAVTCLMSLWRQYPGGFLMTGPPCHIFAIPKQQCFSNY